MNQDLALSVLSEIMNWDLARCRTEFAWLQLMARFKYDGYQDFVAGLRFVESLADWLQQFKPEHREAAYLFLRTHVLYFGPAEINHLVDHFYPGVVRPFLLDTVASEVGRARYLLTPAHPKYRDLLRQTLFFGLSDGARIDSFRRATSGIISNEQILLATEIAKPKWDQVLKSLQKDLNDQARFRVLFLIDDFTATGTTLFGKLERFWRDFSNYGIANSHMSSTWAIHVHHYIATSDVKENLPIRDAAQRTERKGDWFSDLHFSYSFVLPASVKLSEANTGAFWEVIDQYYNSSIETEHTRKGGGKDVKLGFGQCALPLVLEHNTPNNSIPLLWAETDDSNGEHPMRPLFRRRQRHTHLSGI
jgi:hypothetical protein